MASTTLSVMSPTILASNLKRLMTSAGWTQEQLSKRSGVAQTTISLMLRPDDRAQTASGKTASPKLTEVDMIARAFNMHVWQLLIDPAQLAQVVSTALSASSGAVPEPLRHAELISPEDASATSKILTKRKRKGIVSDTKMEKLGGGVFVNPNTKLGAKLRREALQKKVKGPPPEGDLITPPRKEGDDE